MHADPLIQFWIAMFNDYGWFLLIPLLEQLFPARRQPLFRPGLISDIVHTYQPLALHPFLLSGLAYLLVPISGDGPWQNGLAGQPIWAQFVALALFSEITFYFVHRLTHTNKFLWEFHRVHHSSAMLDSFSTSRFHLIDKAFFAAPYVACIAYFGATPEGVFVFSVFQGFMSRYGHSNVNGPWFTGYLITTPHFHRWHHANAPEAQNKNFSRDFVFMDYLFGTVHYPKGQVPSDFGEPGYSNNFFVQQWLPFVHLYRLIRKTPQRVPAGSEQPQ